MIERAERYLRLMVILSIAVVSFSGLALVDSPSPQNNHWNNVDKADVFGEYFESALSSSFENSLKEIAPTQIDLPSGLKIDKEFTIDNRIIDFGLVYQGKVDERFDNNQALRNMLNLLTSNYPHVRREAVQELRTGNFFSVEEQGYVFNDYERFNYVSRIITRNDDAWILLFTFEDSSSEVIRNFLNLFLVEEEGIIG